MLTFSGWRRLVSCVLFLFFGVGAAVASPTVTVFTATDDTGLPSKLVAGLDGSLYFATSKGVFRLTSAGASLVAAIPNGPRDLIAGDDGNFYGVNWFSPQTIFRVSPDGAVTTLALFDGTVATYVGHLVYASDGNLYGDMDTGMFKLTRAGVLTRLTDYRGGHLAEGVGGNLFGGSRDCGDDWACYSWSNIVFKMTPTGVVTQTGSFDCSEGSFAALTSTPTGVLYGSASGNPFVGHGCTGPGGIFSVDESGNYSRLVTLSSDDGVVAPLLYASDGTLFGVTTGYYDFFGTEPSIPSRMFRYWPPANTTLGQLALLRDVVTIPASADTYRALAQTADGTIYGINDGTIFRLKRPTTLAGHGTFSVQPLAGKVTLNPTATLTDDMTGRGVPGQTIQFWRNGVRLCAVPTDVTGTATCKIAAKDHTGGFDAVFDETDLYAASKVHSPLVCVGTVCP